MPSTAADAAGLLARAIADPNPVVFVENKALYFEGGGPDEREPVPLGRRASRGPGRDVTVVALSRLVREALPPPSELAEEGIEVEVVDLRTLVPLDLEAVVESVAQDAPARRRARGGGARRRRRGDRRAGAGGGVRRARRADRARRRAVRAGAVQPAARGRLLPGRAEVAAAVRTLVSS